MIAKQNERCDVRIGFGRTVKLIPEPNAEQLNQKQFVDYRKYRTGFIESLYPNEKAQRRTKV